MAYTRVNWKARQGTNLNKFTKSAETPTSVILTNAPDEVTEAGTPVSVENLNVMDKGIADLDENKVEKHGTDRLMTAAEGAILAGLATHADMVDGMGRDLRLLFGIASADPAVYIPQIMAEIRRRCNNNGEIDASGVPDFIGIEIGDYIDGLDLSGIAAAPGGNAPQAWNDTYKNNRIVVSGFNTYKNSGDTENTKNHILFTFRNIVAQGRMNPTDDNTGGYPASEMRAWLEGADGGGSGTFAAGLKAALNGGNGINYLYIIRKAHSTKSNCDWYNFTVWPPSELEIAGYPTYGDEGVYMGAIPSVAAARAGWNTNVQFPVYQKSYAYRVKRFNGARNWWWLMTPVAFVGADFALVDGSGFFGTVVASNVGGGAAPAFCAA